MGSNPTPSVSRPFIAPDFAWLSCRIRRDDARRRRERLLPPPTLPESDRRCLARRFVAMGQGCDCSREPKSKAREVTVTPCQEPAGAAASPAQCRYGPTTFACRAQLCRLLCHIWHRRRPLERQRDLTLQMAETSTSPSLHAMASPGPSTWKRPHSHMKIMGKTKHSRTRQSLTSPLLESRIGTTHAFT